MASLHHGVKWGAIAVLIGSLTCAQFRTQPHRLYPEPVRPSDQIALLSGPVGTVDGVDVSRQGSLFSLLPGCHIVALRKELGEGGVGGAWSVALPRTTYAFRMQGGHSYEIQALRQAAGGVGSPVSTVGNATSAGGVKIVAAELDAHGKLLGPIAPVRTNADIEACEAAAHKVNGGP